MRKNTVFTLVLIFTTLFAAHAARALEMKVESFEADPTDLANKPPATVIYDGNNKPCAVFYLTSDVPNIIFAFPSKKVVPKGKGTWFIFVDAKYSRNLCFQAENYTECRYQTQDELIPGMVYVMTVRSIGNPIELTGKGTVKINTEPQGATIKLNQVPITAKTPVTLPNQLVGAHSVGIELTDYFTVDTVVTVRNKETINLDIALKLTYGLLSITADPPGSTISIDGKDIAGISFDNPRQPVGRYTVNLKNQPYFFDSTFVATVESGGRLRYKTKLRPNFGTVAIVMEPQEASVKITNSNNQREVALDANHRLLSGNYTFNVTSQPYFFDTTFTVKIEPGGDYRITPTLRPNFGTVRIDRDPETAQMTIIDRVTQQEVTPDRERRLLSGSYVVRVSSQPLFFDSTFTMTVEPGENYRFNPDLRPNFGSLSIDPEPRSAQVTISNITTQEEVTPDSEHRLPAGNYIVKVEDPLYNPFEATVNLAIGGDETLNPKLVRKTGSVRVTSDPAGATIYLDDRSTGQTTNTTLGLIPTGLRNIRLSKSGYTDVSGQVTIRQNETANFSLQLSTYEYDLWKEHATQVRQLALMPGAGHLYDGYTKNRPASTLRGLTYLVTVGGALCKAAILEDNQIRINMLKIAGVIYTWQMVDAWLWGGGKISDVNLAPNYKSPVAYKFNEGSGIRGFDVSVQYSGIYKEVGVIDGDTIAVTDTRFAVNTSVCFYRSWDFDTSGNARYEFTWWLRWTHENGQSSFDSLSWESRANLVGLVFLYKSEKIWPLIECGTQVGDLTYTVSADSGGYLHKTDKVPFKFWVAVGGRWSSNIYLMFTLGGYTPVSPIHNGMGVTYGVSLGYDLPRNMFW